MSRLLLSLVLLVPLLAACGEHQEARQARLYGANAYKVAGDTTPWSNPPYSGDEMAWQQDIDARGKLQNEYQRIR